MSPQILTNNTEHMPHILWHLHFLWFITLLVELAIPHHLWLYTAEFVQHDCIPILDVLLWLFYENKAHYEYNTKSIQSFFCTHFHCSEICLPFSIIMIFNSSSFHAIILHFQLECNQVRYNIYIWTKASL